jgi:hypothetical protein
MRGREPVATSAMSKAIRSTPSVVSTSTSLGDVKWALPRTSRTP